MKIKEMVVEMFHVPLKEMLVDSLHGDHTHFDLITVTLTSEDGIKGTGYTYTGGRGGYSITAMIDKDLRRYIVDKEIERPEELKKQLDKALHYVGRGGILAFAVSAVDIAVWDIFTKAAGKPIYEYLGGQRKPITTYYGGIDLAYSKEKLLQNIENQLKKGHTGIKIKVGHDDPNVDIERMHAVRELVGEETKFMIDANMVWDLDRAKLMADAAAKENVMWIEEPMNPDDLESYRKLADYTSVPIAMGENLHIYFEHKHAIEVGHIKYPQPDASNIGGITGWLEIAKLAKDNGLTVSTHGMQELHVNLLAGVDNPGYMEYHSFPIDEYTTYKLEIKNGTILPNDEPGTGVTFNWDKLAPYKVVIA